MIILCSNYFLLCKSSQCSVSKTHNCLLNTRLEDVGGGDGSVPWRGGRHGYGKSAADGWFLFLLDDGCCGRLAAAGLRTGATDTLSFVLLCLALDFLRF